MKKKVIIGGTLVVLLVIFIGGFWLFKSRNDGQKNFVKTDYNNLDLDGIDKLMVVAHPDDDILWGGTKLMNEDFLVVCVTCGSVQKRVEEFENVMHETNDAYVMLGYPDKTNGERDNWDSCRDDIIEDIKNIYNLKEWKEVVTHNPEGEYGHQHHIMTSEIVTSQVDTDILTYFGKYYSKNNLEENGIELPKMDDETLERKKEILKLYESQEGTIAKFEHMHATEDMLSYEEWMKKYDEKAE